MPSSSAKSRFAPEIAGIGVITGLGAGVDALREGLYAGTDLFRPLAREGRQLPDRPPAFVGVEVPEAPRLPSRLPPRMRRGLSLSAQLALAVLEQAWDEAGLDALAPERVGLVIGGSNLQSRHLLLTQRAHSGERLSFLRPRYGLSFWDTDLCGLCCEAFNIQGLALTVGGASASGALAILQAAEALAAGRVDACVALGAAQDLSYYELQGLRAMGAMAAGDEAIAAPGEVCRPFDAGRRGFVFGEMSAAVVLRRPGVAGSIPPYGRLSGWAQSADGARGPAPSAIGERRAIAGAIAGAGLAPGDVAYVNTHGTGSPLGDDTELEALIGAGLGGAYLNSTKSILGHGLSAAGTVEFVATVIQLCDGRLHPTRNLERPIDPERAWVRGETPVSALDNALSLSLGFSGTNVALTVQRP